MWQLLSQHQGYECRRVGPASCHLLYSGVIDGEIPLPSPLPSPLVVGRVGSDRVMRIGELALPLPSRSPWENRHCTGAQGHQPQGCEDERTCPTPGLPGTSMGMGGTFFSIFATGYLW